MRVYVGTTLSALRALRDHGFGAPMAAHGVTGALREWYADADAEELEYAAAADAATCSLRLLRPGEPMRRVVVAADVPDAAVTTSTTQPDAGPGLPSSVLVTQPIALSHVVSLHVDDLAAEPDVAAAVEALPAGEADAQYAIDAVDDHELLWYDVTELDDVVREAACGE